MNEQIRRRAERNAMSPRVFLFPHHHHYHHQEPPEFVDRLPAAVQERFSKLAIHETVFKMDYQADDAGGLEHLCGHITQRLKNTTSGPERLPKNHWQVFNAIVECAAEKVKHRQIPEVSKKEFTEAVKRNLQERHHGASSDDVEFDVDIVIMSLETYGLVKRLSTDGQILVEPISWLTLVSLCCFFLLFLPFFFFFASFYFVLVLFNFSRTVLLIPTLFVSILHELDQDAVQGVAPHAQLEPAVRPRDCGRQRAAVQSQGSGGHSC